MASSSSSSVVPSGTNPHNNKPYSRNYHLISASIEKLPVVAALPRLTASLKENKVLVLIGETGSGKTTQFPKYIVERAPEMLSGLKLAVTQNRRLAASSVGNRIAEEMDVAVGTTVAVIHRGRNDSLDGVTKFDIITDGSLLAAARSNLTLPKYGMLIFDEADQHSVHTDLLLGVTKILLRGLRPDLYVVIMSATLDADLFQKFLPQAKIERVPGRQHMVYEEYLSMPAGDVIQAAVDTVLQCALTERNGQILVFAPGVPEIHKIIAGVTDAIGEGGVFATEDIGPMKCYALHAKMSNAEQDNVVNAVPPTVNGVPGRKLIVATNVAEASITIDDVTIVIDTGLEKQELWDSEDECWAFQTVFISKAQKIQRVGRAGRQMDGKAFMLYTEGGYHRDLREHAVPAIMLGDMLSECLTILCMDQDPQNFPYVSRPATETLAKALGILYQLLAIDHVGKLTAHGKGLASIPLDPYLAELILCSQGFGCSDEILSIVSMIEALEGSSLEMLQIIETKADKVKAAQALKPLRHPRGDHLTLLNIYQAWRTACSRNTPKEFCELHMLNMSVLRRTDQTRWDLLRRLRQQTTWKAKSLVRTDPEFYTKIISALAYGNFLKVAKHVQKNQYVTLRQGKEANVRTPFPGGKLHDIEYVLYNKHTRRNGKPDELKIVTCVPLELLVSSRPNYWWDVELVAPPSAKDAIATTIARMIGKGKEAVRGNGMPLPPPKAQK